MEQQWTMNSSACELLNQLETNEQRLGETETLTTNTQAQLKEKDEDVQALQETMRANMQQASFENNNGLNSSEEEMASATEVFFDAYEELGDEDIADQERFQGTEEQINLTLKNERETNTVEEQLNDSLKQGPKKLNGHKMQLEEFQSKLITNEEEKITPRESTSEFRGKRQLLQERGARQTKPSSEMITEEDVETSEHVSEFRRKRKPWREKEGKFAKLQIKLKTNKQEITTLNKQSTAFIGQTEGLQEGKEQLTELESNLSGDEDESKTVKERAIEIQEKGENRRQVSKWVRVTEEQRQLGTKEQEIREQREETNDHELQGKGERALEDQQEIIGPRRSEQIMASLGMQLNEFRIQREELREVEQQDVELLNQLGTSEHELVTLSEEVKEFEQEELQGKEEQCVTEWQSRLKTKEEDLRTTRERLSELQGQAELLRQNQQRVHELQSQLQTKEEELETTTERLSEFQGQAELLRQNQQRVHELQSQLQTREEDLRTTAERLSEFQGQAELLRQNQQRVHELQSQLQTRLCEFQGQEELLRQQQQQRVSELQRQLQTREQETRENVHELEVARQEITELRNQLDVEIGRMREQLQTKEEDLRTTRERLSEFQGQAELLRQNQQQRVHELQSQLQTREQETRENVHELVGARHEITELRNQLDVEIGRKREQLNEFQRQGEQLRDEQNRVVVLQRELAENEQELRLLTANRQDNPPDWVINRSEIQLNRNQQLGQGAWADVFRGRFRGCDVAVKEMHTNLAEFRELFGREADIASKFRHPCLLQFIGATADDGTPLLVTEIMDCSLRERLQPIQYHREEPSLAEEEVTIIFLDVARALNYLHERPSPVIHHDISSANVLLWRRGGQWRAKVSDYGNMNFVRQSSRDNVGAPPYCAPEFLTENPQISCKVDVYSFGVVLCETCIRQQPNPQQRREQIDRIRNRHFKELVRRCVEEEPGARPNMEEVIEHLERR